MRFVPIRTVLYVALFAIPSVAQPTLISSEMPHVELSVGAGAMTAGPGASLEHTMIDLGLTSRLGKFTYPNTSPPNVIPGVFAQVSVGVAQHAMVGLFLGADETTTSGRTPEGSSMAARVNVRTRAVLASYRPTPWLKIGAGPALMRRLLEFESTGLAFSGDTPGWLATADAKFARRPLTPEQPPAFGYVTVQYRGSPGLAVPATQVPLYGSDRRYAAWPAERLRTSHWMIGLGVGFEI